MQGLTYSMISAYLTCRRLAYWRYVQEIVRRGRDETPLYLGKLVHQCLDMLLTGHPLELIRAEIDHACIGHEHEADLRRVWHLARAMMRGYYVKYGRDDESFKVLETEMVFEVPILNPATGRASRKHKFTGRIDGLVRLHASRDLMLLEHKTASSIGADYLTRLWTDLQSLLYVHALRMLGYPVVGVIYNIIGKAKIKQTQGESEAEYQARYRLACEKSKSGKSSAKRRMPETDEAYQARLAEWYAQPEAFHREVLYFDERRFGELELELWHLQKEISHAETSGVWLRNPGACYKWGRACPYYALCSSGDSPFVLAAEYEQRIKHSELKDERKPIF
jgi:hypothetical protein